MTASAESRNYGRLVDAPVTSRHPLQRTATESREQLDGTVVGQLALAMEAAAKRGDSESLDSIAVQIQELCDRERRASLQAEHRARTENARNHEYRTRLAELMAELQMTRAELDKRFHQPPPVTPARDVEGSDMRPDPGSARTPVEYIQALRLFHIWAGRPSYRTMERASGGSPVASTFCKLLRRDDLPPRFEAIDAFLRACGAREDDLMRFSTAWRRLSMPVRATANSPGRLRSVPRTRATAKPA